MGLFPLSSGPFPGEGAPTPPIGRGGRLLVGEGLPLPAPVPESPRVALVVLGPIMCIGSSRGKGGQRQAAFGRMHNKLGRQPQPVRPQRRSQVPIPQARSSLQR
jgi:hypothetical protein